MDSPNKEFTVVPATYRPSRKHLRGDNDVNWSYLIYCFIATCFAFVFAPLVLEIATFVPNIDTGSQMFENWYFRIMVNTTWLPFQQFVMFLLLSVYGWAFVNLVNCQRSNPFTDGNYSYGGIKKLVCYFVPFIFLISGIIVFRSEKDLAGYCTTANSGTHHKTVFLRASHEEENSVVLSQVLSQTTEDNGTLLLLHTLQQGDYMHDFHLSGGANCHDYTLDEVFQWNFYLWVTSFVLLGLQYTHADIGPLKHFTLTWASMKTWGPALWAVFISWAVAIFFILYLDVKDLQQCDKLTRYAVYLAAIIGFCVWNSKRLAPEKSIHIHHYCIGFLIVTIIGYQSEVLTLVHGFAMGMMIEGGCRWGFDPIWNPTYGDYDDDKILEAKMEHKHTPTERRRWAEIKAHQEQLRKENAAVINSAHTANVVHEEVARVTQHSAKYAAPQTNYLQPMMVNMPVPTQVRAPIQGYGMPVTYVSYPQMPQAMAPQPMFTYPYHPEPVHQMVVDPEQAIAPQRNQPKSKLPSELLGLLSPEL